METGMMRTCAEAPARGHVTRGWTARRVALVAALCVAVGWVVEGRTPTTADAELHFQLANLLWDEARYPEALVAYRAAAQAAERPLAIKARIGVVRTALVMG